MITKIGTLHKNNHFRVGRRFYQLNIFKGPLCSWVFAGTVRQEALKINQMS